MCNFTFNVLQIANCCIVKWGTLLISDLKIVQVGLATLLEGAGLAFDIQKCLKVPHSNAGNSIEQKSLVFSRHKQQSIVYHLLIWEN